MSQPVGVRACPSCGTPYDETEVRFCGRCGAEVQRRPDRDARDATRATEPAGQPSLSATESAEFAAQDPLVGRIIDGRYRVQARIGQGGMGAVYRVEHVAMGKVAAMKVLHPSLSQEAEVVRRFRREAEAVSRLSHPNTVQVFDFGQAAGSMYLVMELVRGEDLGALLRRDGPLPWRRLAPMLLQVLDALSEAHEMGIIHRDLKPENLLISRTRDGRDLVKVLDFGLAKLRDVEELNAVTGRGTVIGTPYYMSPEQIRAEDLDARSDLYSLGALSYRALTGEHPFSAATPVAVLTQHLTTTLEPLRSRPRGRDVPEAAERVVMRAMEKRPEARFQNAEEMRRAVDAATTATTPSTAAADAARRESDASASGVSVLGVPERLKREDFDGYERSLRVRRWAALSLVPLVLLGAAGTGYYYLRGGPAAVSSKEKEPNNDPATANEIRSGEAISGRIGKRRSTEESDRDFFHLTVSPPNNRMDVEVSGIPDMDIILQVFDGQGHEIAESETGAEGDAESIHDLRVAPGDYYIEVREVWVAGTKATENISDWYSLKATVDVASPGEELEPNDEPGTANVATGPPAATTTMVGRLSHPGDVDCFAVPDPRPSAIGATVSGLEGVELKLSLVPTGGKLGQKGAGARSAEAHTGEAVRLDKQPWTGSTPPVVCVERRDRPQPRPDGHAVHAEHAPHVALPSRSATYTLTIDASH